LLQAVVARPDRENLTWLVDADGLPQCRFKGLVRMLADFQVLNAQAALIELVCIMAHRREDQGRAGGVTQYARTLAWDLSHQNGVALDIQAVQDWSVPIELVAEHEQQTAARMDRMGEGVG
jgi:hypothetical protein